MLYASLALILFFNVIIVKIMTFDQMIDELIKHQESKVARVMGCIFYAPALGIRYLYDSIKEIAK